MNQINNNQNVADQKDILITSLQSQLSQYNFNTKEINNEVKILFPTITSLAIGNYTIENKENRSKIIPVILYQTKKKIDFDTQQKMKLWLKERLKKDSIEVYQQNN
jgi:hypothetical protein